MAPAETALIHRIIVRLSHDNVAATAIASAADLARALGAQLCGLFIEDALVCDAAAFPLMRAITPHEMIWRSLTSMELAEAHALAARAAQRRLQQEAAALGVAARFEVVRDDPVGVLQRYLQRTDLRAVIEPADTIARSMGSSSQLVFAGLQVPAAVLYLPHTARRRAGPVVAVARTPDDPVLELATTLAGALREQLVVLSVGQTEAELRIEYEPQELPVAGVMARFGARTIEALRGTVQQGLRPCRERLLVLRRPTRETDLTAYLRLATERAVPLLLVD